MRNLLFLLLVLSCGCRNRSATANNAGWEQVAGKPTPELSTMVLNILPSQYYASNRMYDYFALRFLRPLSNGETPIGLETSQNGDDWVRVFILKAGQLKFITEATGEVTKVEANAKAGTICLTIGDNSSIVLVNRPPS